MSIERRQKQGRAPCVIGVDVGNTRQTAVLADSQGRILRRLRRQVDRAGGETLSVENLKSLVSALLSEAQADGVRISRIGVGFGGPVDYATGTVLLSHQTRGWENQPLKQILEEAFGLPTVVDNDANAAALGEWRFGAGRGVRDLIYINVGTGIGSGVISDGRLVRGARNLAGEIGHMTIEADGPVCTCGRRGCVESLCSGPHIALRARQRVKRPTARTALSGTCTSEDVFEAAAGGDPVALEIVEEVADHLAHAIGNAVCLLNPQLVILGGGVVEAGDALLESVRQHVPDYCLALHTRSLRIVAARLGYDAGVRGAVALAIEDEGATEGMRRRERSV